MVHRDIAGYVDGDISWAPTKKVVNAQPPVKVYIAMKIYGFPELGHDIVILVDFPYVPSGKRLQFAIENGPVDDYRGFS